MPRNGAGVYNHPFPNVVEGTTIESAVFNGNTSDVEQDLNTPRPIVAGGTGANNAHDALIALSGEEGMQVVTNYDSFPFVAGSFLSAPGATGEPVPGGGFYTSGICHKASGVSMVLEAYVYNQGGTNPVRKFTREKWVTWEPWKQVAMSLADSDARYVNQAGDTMQGNLTIQPPSGSALIVLNKAVTASAGFLSMMNGVARWSIDLGDAAPESGSNVGSDFYLRRYSDAGAQLGLSIGINRATGAIATTGNINTSNGNINCGAGNLNAGRITASNDMMSYNGAGTNGTYYFGNGGTKYINYDSVAFNVVGGSLIVASNIASALTATTGFYYFGTGTKYLNYDGSSFNFVGGPLVVGSGVACGPAFAGLSGGDLSVNRGGGGGAIFFGAATKYLYMDGTAFSLVGAPLNTAAHTVTGSMVASLDVTSQNGSLAMNPAKTVYFRFDGSYTTTYTYANVTQTYWRGTDNAFIHLGGAYKPGGGAWADSSDARIKNELGEYPRGLAEIAALRPVYYTYKGNDTDAPPAYPKDVNGEIDTKIAEEPLTVPYPNSNHKTVAENATKYAGLIAQEVELVFPEMVKKRSAYIDGQPVDDLRDLDTTPLVFALINAVRELKAEVDALKAAR